MISTLAWIAASAWQDWIFHIEYTCRRHPERLLAASSAVLVLVSVVAMPRPWQFAACLIPYRLFRWIWRFVTHAELRESCEEAGRSCEVHHRTASDLRALVAEIRKRNGNA
jgi:hypothetical protein